MLKYFKISNLFFILYFATNLMANNLAKLDNNPNISKELKLAYKKLQVINIGKEYKYGLYNKKFADFAKLDKNKAVKLSETLNAIALTITETKPETEQEFAQYNCKMHLFVDNRDDYWLPKGEWGSWFEISKIFATTENLFGADASIDKTDYSMRSFLGNKKYQNYPNFHANVGSLLLEEYVKNIYPGMTYLTYGFMCYGLPEPDSQASIWLEKKGGPDFQYETAAPRRPKLFYHFDIPDQLLYDSCKYIQKATLISEFEFFKIYKNHSLEQKNINELYRCN